MTLNKNSFYIKENLIFSNKEVEIEIPDKIQIHFPIKVVDVFKTNKEIIHNLKKTNRKKLTLYGEIKEEKTIQNIEKRFKEDKLSFEKPKNDNYEFIEVTSQIEIITQILASLNTQDIENTKNQLREYSLRVKAIEEKENKLIDEKIEAREEILEEVRKKIDEFNDEKILPIKNKIAKLETKIKTLENEVLADNSKEKNFKLEKINLKKEKLEKKLLEEKENIEEIHFKITHIKTKISFLQEEKKRGKKRIVRPFLFTITLGLIYWTPLSLIQNRIYSLDRLLHKNKEKHLIKEQKIKRIEKGLEKLKKDESEILKKLSKQEQKEHEQKENIENEIKNLEKDLKENNKILDKENKEIEKIKDKENKEKNILENLIEQKEEILESSCHKIEETLEEIKKKREKCKTISEEMVKRLEKQKTTIKGEWILN